MILQHMIDFSFEDFVSTKIPVSFMDLKTSYTVTPNNFKFTF